MKCFFKRFISAINTKQDYQRNALMVKSKNVRALIFLPKTDPFIAWTTRRILFFLPKGV